MMEIIYLIDNNTDLYGHFTPYRQCLNNLAETKELVINNLYTLPQNSNKFLLLINRYVNFKKTLNKIPRNNVAHFLYADLYFQLPIIYHLSHKIILTVHSLPEGKFKRIRIKIFLNKSILVIVHSDYIYQQIKKMGIKNVIKIDYPSLYDYSNLIKNGGKNAIKERWDIKPDKIILSALGGTRYDKGLDILLESFKYINNDIKSKIILNIAGKPIDFDKSYIMNKSNEYNIPIRLTLRGLTENEFMGNVLITNYMILPYRKIMTANSGPMTEAITCNIPSLVPDYGNLNNIVQQKHVGITFKSENPRDLGRAITQIILNSKDYKFDFSYKNELSKDHFLKMHHNVYEKILNL